MPLTTRVLSAATAAIVVTCALAGCAPVGPGAVAPSVTASAGASASTSVPAASPTTSPTASSTTEPLVDLPAECTAIYSAGMLAMLEQQNPPLNDPGVTLYSTDQASLLELLQTLPTLRCSWGRPSEYGLATNVSILDRDQSAVVEQTVRSAGFGCEQADGAQICRIEERGVTLDDVEFVRGETHALRGNLWVSTVWINFAPEGYTEDIVQTVWG